MTAAIPLVTVSGIAVLDENNLIHPDELLSLTKELIPNGNVLNAKKVRSFANKGVQLADFISGAIRDKYEHDDGRYIEAISEKISLAHET